MFFQVVFPIKKIGKLESIFDMHYPISSIGFGVIQLSYDKEGECSKA
jgi:hypothetical protein